ncbi:MAG TPA: hypothetical protein VF813_05885 [Anaerolineaceae bacterium]
MAKTFYTERDIEDLARQGVHSLVVNDSVVLTELAVEKAGRLGVSLVREHDTPPSAPVRPYLSTGVAPVVARPQAPAQSKDDLRRRVHDAVIARLGGEVDPALLETIIRRVLDNLGSL